MRRLAAALLLCALCLSSWSAQAVRIQRVTSPGGVEAWLVEDRSVPIVTLRVAFRGGAALDPAGKEGLADMVSGLLDEGAGDLGSQAFQRALEDVSASIGFDAGRDLFGATLRTLAAHRAEAFRLFRLALTEPRFDAGPVERIRAQLVAALMSGRENPRRIAGRTWYRTVFPDHPYGRPVAGTQRSIEAIGRADLRRFVAGRLARDNLVVGVVGDIGADELGRRLDELFGALPARAERGETPEAAVRGAGALVVVRRPIPQSVVVFGQAGVKRDDPDYYAAYVMNYVLGGGGFSSRLTEQIRAKRGLAYDVHSYLNPFAKAGLIMGGLGTRNAGVAQSLGILRREWSRLGREGIGEAELAAAKTYLNGSFPLGLDSSRRIAGILVAIQIHDLGIDYVERRPRLIDAVTAADVRRVARRLLDGDQLAIVVVGDPEGVAAR